MSTRVNQVPEGPRHGVVTNRLMTTESLRPGHVTNRLVTTESPGPTYHRRSTLVYSHVQERDEEDPAYPCRVKEGNPAYPCRVKEEKKLYLGQEVKGFCLLAWQRSTPGRRTRSLADRGPGMGQPG